MAYDVLPRRGSAPTASFPSCPLGWLIDDSLKAAMQVPPGKSKGGAHGSYGSAQPTNWRGASGSGR